MDHQPTDPDGALQLLQCEPPDLRGCVTGADAAKRLEAWKRGPLRDAFRAAAKRWHPDRNQPDQAGHCSQRMAHVSAARALLEALEPIRHRPPTTAVRVVVRHGATFSGSTSTSTATGASGARASTTWGNW